MLFLGFLGVLIFAVICPTQAEVELFEDPDLVKLNTVHEHYCPATPRCFPRPINVTDDAGNAFLWPPTSNTGIDGSCCKKCSCDLQTCALSGTCCPDTLVRLPTVKESRAEQKITCEEAQLRPTDSEAIPTELALWMFTKCADDFADPLISLKCESNVQNRSRNFDDILPVTDLSTGFVYKNRYCALCNHLNETQFSTWEAKLKCSFGTFTYPGVETVIEKILQTEYCNIIYITSEEISAGLGSGLPLCEPVIRECNVTGKWKEFDPFLEKACHAYEAIFDGKEDNISDISTLVKYKNIFCYQCNEDKSPIPYCPSTPGGIVFVSFSAILHLQSPSLVTGIVADPVSCSDSQVKDPLKLLCRDVECLPPKTYLQGNCTDSFSTLSGVLHEAFIKVVPSKAMDIAAMSSVAMEITNKLKSLFGDDTSWLRVVTLFDLYYKPRLNFNHTGQDTAMVVEYFVFHIKAIGNPMYGASSLAFLNKVLEIDGSTETIFVRDAANRYSEAGVSIVLQFELDVFSPVLVSEAEVSVRHLGTADGSILSYYGPVQRFFSGSFVSKEVHLITKTTGCPLVDISDYPSERLNNGELFVEDLGFTFPAKAYTSKANQNESILVCKDDFILLVQKKLQLKERDSKPHSTDKDDNALGILSLVCVVLSLVCLVLTLVTYLAFKDLRTQPGINNICLVLSLIIAQSLYQFGVGQADQVPAWGCQTLGVLIHFFWLMSVFWMNVCSYHMFRVFSSLTKISRGGNIVKRTILYLLYCFTASAVFVAINLVVSSVKSSSTEMGYGGTLCYVSDYFMNLYTFAIPVGVVVLVNISLFVSVIVKVTRMPTVDKTTRTNRNYVKIYAKLSCLTGVSWLFGFLSYTGVVAFEFLFVIFTASQGVFIFFSFVCNARVLKQCTHLVKRDKAVGSSTKSPYSKTSSTTDGTSGPSVTTTT